MQREIIEVGYLGRHGCWCCPAHDKLADDSYKNRRSKKARARDKKVEHQLVRTVAKRILNKELQTL